MKLVYLWVESYEFINQQGYLLNSEYEVQSDDKERCWIITKKPNLDALLYGENISITAIVGDNGAGKSTLLDTIRLMLFDERSRKKKMRGFLVWEDEGGLEMLSLMEELPCVKYEDTCVVDRLLPQDFNLIYYSDFLDLKYYSEDFDDGEDVDTYAEEIQDEFRNRYSIQINISTSHLLRTYNSKAKDYFHSDIKKQITYFNEQKNQKLLVSMPKNLFIKMEFLDVDILDKVLDDSLSSYNVKGNWKKDGNNVDSLLIDVLKKMKKEFYRDDRNGEKPRDEMDIIRWNIWITYIYNLLNERMHNHEERHDYSYIDKCLESLIPKYIVELSTLGILEYIFKSSFPSGTEFELYREFYDRLLHCMDDKKSGDFNVTFSVPDDMFSIIYDHRLWKYMSLDDQVEVADREEIYMEKSGWNGSWELESFMNLYDSYIKICYEIDFLKFSWGLSTGEGNMFNLFARLYEAMKKDKKEKNLIIFDELDSSFHPQWQQEIIKELTTFLRNVYPQKEFQIILTTHSPVLLSDIPRENVIFMKKNNTSKKEHTQTFAANIASLYYDSFFMDKGSIGEIAKNTIGNLLDAISTVERLEEVDNREEKLLSEFMKKQFSKEESVNAGNKVQSGYLTQKLIDNIGEDIWRYKINEKYHRFLNQDEVILEQEIWNNLKALEEKKGKEAVQRLFVNWAEDKR